MPSMARKKRTRGTGEVYIKYRLVLWTLVDAGRRPHEPEARTFPDSGHGPGPTRTQAEKRLRELMATVQVTSDPRRTVDVAGRALLERLEARACAKSHIESVESHLRVHIVPFFGDKSLDRIHEDDVTRLRVGPVGDQVRQVVAVDAARPGQPGRNLDPPVAPQTRTQIVEHLRIRGRWSIGVMCPGHLHTPMRVDLVRPYIGRMDRITSYSGGSPPYGRDPRLSQARRLDARQFGARPGARSRGQPAQNRNCPAGAGRS
jgi:hypothetical protein